jgi:hypothetical protein
MADCSDNRLWTPCCRSTRGERRKRDEDMRNRVEAGPGGWNNRRPILAAVSDGVPHPRRFRRRALFVDRRRARPSVRLPVPVVTTGDKFRDRINCRRPLGGSKRHEAVRKPMERREGGGNDRRPDLAAVSGAMPHAPKLRRAVGRFRAGAGPCPSVRACLPVRLPVPVVATIGSRFDAGVERWRASGPGGRPIYDRARGPRALSIGHCRLGQHAEPHLSLFGNPLLRADPQGRLYVRS